MYCGHVLGCLGGGGEARGSGGDDSELENGREVPERRLCVCEGGRGGEGAGAGLRSFTEDVAARLRKFQVCPRKETFRLPPKPFFYLYFYFIFLCNGYVFQCR